MDFTREDHDALIALGVHLAEFREAHGDEHTALAAQLGRDFNELQRRLADLNHAHEEARRKEGDFASKDEMKVAFDDVIRRIDNVQAAVGICLPRETFDAAMQTQHDDADKRDDAISTLSTQVQRIAANTQGRDVGTEQADLARYRFRAAVFSAIAAFVGIAGLVIAAVSIATRN